MNERYLASDPYPWPYDGQLTTSNTALVIIDMRRPTSAARAGM